MTHCHSLNFIHYLSINKLPVYLCEINAQHYSFLQDKNVRFIDEYDEGLSHLIISGSDIMLCPSLDDHLLQVPVSVSFILVKALPTMSKTHLSFPIQ